MKKILITATISFCFFSCSKKEQIPKKEIKGFELSNTLLKTTSFAIAEEKTSSQSKAGLSIPSKAVISDKNRSFVIVYKSRTDIKIKEIKILEHNSDSTYITTGLLAGDSVITNNQLRIYKSLKN